MPQAPLFYTEDQCFELAIGYLRGQYPGRSLGPKNFLGQLARALAQLVGALQQAQEQAYKDGVPGYQVDFDGVIRSRATRQALENWAFVYGLPSNRGAGVFGSNGPTPATGGTANITGVPGTIVPAGSQLVDGSGGITLQLVTGVTIPGGGLIGGVFNSLTLGAAGNLPVNSQLTWQAPPPGLAASVTLSGPLSGGLDEESDIDLVGRLIRMMQAPQRGGTAADWRRWAEAATDSGGKPLGVTRAYVYPHRNGIGSVDVVITQAGAGTGRDPGATVAAAVQAFLDQRRIATDTVRVVRPDFPATQAIRGRVRIMPTPAYRFDWDDLGVGVQLVSYATTSLVIMGASPPAALQSAIDLGSKPRIQVGIVGFVVPRQRRCLSYVIDSPIAGQCTLTLDSALDAGGFSSSDGYAGGPAVEQIAQAVADLLNHQRGPSKQSGYADDLYDSWVDVVDVGSIAAAALAQLDASGRKLVSISANIGQVGAAPGTGVTISVNFGSYTALDFRTYDNTPGTNGPQLPELTLLLVTS